MGEFCPIMLEYEIGTNNISQQMRSRRSLAEQPSGPQSPVSEEEHEADPNTRNRNSQTQANTAVNSSTA